MAQILYVILKEMIEFTVIRTVLCDWTTMLAAVTKHIFWFFLDP
jgi:hypothetical protein